MPTNKFKIELKFGAHSYKLEIELKFGAHSYKLKTELKIGAQNSYKLKIERSSTFFGLEAVNEKRSPAQ